MQIGMLWLDDDQKRPLEEKVQRAVEYYWEKYGRWPELCLVNPTEISDKMRVGKVEVTSRRTVLPHHFWLGMKNA
ncbi:MAG: hypothetical protein GY796_28510 [Chloroflexi bacterium]|nr:hypothetical protein [Chloroflexota bacterium]